MRGPQRQSAIIWSLRVAPLVLIGALWVWATREGGVSPILLPKVDAVLSELWEMLRGGAIYANVWVTTQEIVLAFIIALVLGMLTGLLASRTRLRALVIEGPLAWGYMVPNVLFYPLFILWAGVGMTSKVVFAALAGFFPIAMNTLAGFRTTDHKLVTMATAFGATESQVERAVKFGGALPMILAGVRIGAALTIINVILAEMLAAQAGLGYELTRSSQTLQIARLYALIIFLAVFVSVINRLIEARFRQQGPTAL